MLYLSIILYFIVLVAGTKEASPCATAASTYHYPVATFCQDSHVSSTEVVMDGYYAFSHHELLFCPCMISTDQNDTLQFNLFNFETAVILNSSCGSSIDFGNGSFKISCGVYGSLKMTAYQNVDVYLQKDSSEADTRYCVLILTERKNATISISCNASEVEVNETTTVSSVSTSNPTTADETTVITSTLTNADATPLSTAELKATSPPIFVSSPNSTGATPNIVTEKDNKEDDTTTLYTAVGGGSGAVAFVGAIIVIIIWLVYRRKIKKQQQNSQSNPSYNEDNEDGILKDNVLYVSAESVDTTSRPSSEFIVDGNSSVELNGLEISVQDDMNGKFFSEKPIIAPKPRKSDSVRGLEENEMRSFTKHVRAPGDTGCEYAVVNKEKPKTVRERDNYDNSSKPIIDHTYAVVDKANKSKSIDKETQELPLKKEQSAEVKS